jgi:hypothetical protein
MCDTLRGASLAFLEHDRYPIAREKLFGSLEGFGLVSSEDRHHSDALRQVSDYIEQQAQYRQSGT